MRDSSITVLARLALVFVASLAASCRGPGPTVGDRPGESPAPTFPPEATDHLAMTVRAEVEIFAIGKDVLDLQGTVAVHRSGPMGAGGNQMVGAMVGASLRGTSKVFGEVVAVQSPTGISPCEYVCEGPGRYRGHFDIVGWFWLPRHDLWIFTGAPIRVEGIAAAIPPVGQKAEMASGEVALLDHRKPRDNPVGVVRKAVGEVHRVVGIDEFLETYPVTFRARRE